MRSRASEPTVGPLPTLILALLLVVPFAVHQLTAVEPYPAAILPQGASKLSVEDGHVTYLATQILGSRPSGELVVIEPEPFLDPILVHYLIPLARTDFGLAERGAVEMNVRGTAWGVRIPRPDPSDAERAALRAWLRGRLREMSLGDRRLVVRHLEVVAESATGDTVLTRVIAERTIDL